MKVYLLSGRIPKEPPKASSLLRQASPQRLHMIRPESWTSAGDQLILSRPAFVILL